MFRLEQGEEIEPGIKRMLVECIDDSLAKLGDPAGDLDTAIHETRKNFKKMRATLRLVRGALGEKVYRRENVIYRDTSRLLAPLRDSAVLVETVGLMKEQYRPELVESAFAGISERLAERQEEVRIQFLERGDTVSEVQEALTAARTRVLEMTLQAQGAAAMLPGLRRVYRRGKKRMNQVYGGQGTPEVFHDWRKRVKYLWHHIEILHIVWPEYMAALDRELHLLSKYLGDHHDLVVLRETLTTEQDRFSQETEVPVLLDLLDQQQHELEQLARPVGERLYVDPAGVFARRLGTYWQVGFNDGFYGVPPEVTEDVNGISGP